MTSIPPVTSPTKGGLHRRISLSLWQLGLIFCIGFGPLTGEFFFNLWKFEIHQFFPIALLGAAVLAWRGLAETEMPLNRGSPFVTLPMILLYLGLLAWATMLWSPWIGVVAVLAAIAATVWWIGGVRLTKSLLPAWIMLLTVIPPPMKLDTRFALFLQHLAVAGSSRILGLMAVPHLRSGNVLEIPGHRLLVEQACSGINSVLFMTSICFFYALWQRRSFPFLILLYILTLSAILFGNLIRITSGAWILFNFNIDLLSGWRHETLGLILTALYLLFIIVADAVLARIFCLSGGAENREIKCPVKLKSLLEARSLGAGGIVVVTLLLILGVGQLFAFWDFNHYKESERRVDDKTMDGSAKFSLPDELAGWTLQSPQKPTPVRTAFEKGVFSHIWTFEKDGLVAVISLDYPFYEYHDVRICYLANGWKVGESKLHAASNLNDVIPFMEVEMSKEGGLKGQLFFSTVSHSGLWLDENGARAAYDEQGNTLEGGLLTRIIMRIRRSTHYETTYRIQLLSSAVDGLDDGQQYSVINLFQQARLLLAKQFIVAPKIVHDTNAIAPLDPDTTGSDAPADLPSSFKKGIQNSSFQ
jgi:exosortase